MSARSEKLACLYTYAHGKPYVISANIQRINEL